MRGCKYFGISVRLVAAGAVGLSVVPAGARGDARGARPPVVIAPVSDTMSASLALAEKAIDAKRAELHVPGAALVIVKDDKIIYCKGLGLKDAERKLPVTPDTLFAIGSSSKAFTALAVEMSADAGKLALTDSPKKYLPYFKLRDPEADSKITISDLLCHRSGLDRTDLLWVGGALNSTDLIRALATIKPTAKLGEKFQYQNLMFLTAGQIVGEVEHSSWQKLMADRIFKPLGMRDTQTSVPATLKAPDHALGYTYNETRKALQQLPMRDITCAAPAGAINSNARDMAQWLRLMLGRGAFEGKRLVSERGYEEITSKHMSVQGVMDYGYGWFLRDWHGHKVVEHGGNIDGFNAEVALMPDQHIGFALLTNVSASSLGETTLKAVWENLVGLPKEEGGADATGPQIQPDKEAGTYHSAVANLDMQITFKDGKLTMKRVGGQNTILLEKVGPRRYKAGKPTPDGTFVRFHADKDKPGQNAMTLETEQGNLEFTLAPAQPDANATPQPGSVEGPLKELIGNYDHTESGFHTEVALKDGKVSLLVAGQPPYALVEKSKDKYSLAGLPPAFSLETRRDASGKVTGLFLTQPPPQPNLELKRAAGGDAPLIAVEELMRKRIEAVGGETNLRKHRSSIIKYTLTMENQGIMGKGTLYNRAPAAHTDETTLYAVGKRIGATRDFFDGKQGADENSFSPEVTFKNEKAVADARIAADFYALLNWKTLFKTVAVKRAAKVGEEDVYVVEMTPEKGNPVTEYISTKTFRILKRDSVALGPNDTPVPRSETFGDFRTVDGVVIAYRREQNTPGVGEVVMTLTDVKWNATIPDTAFQPRARRQ